MKIVKPVFIISCPRSGSSLLFKILSESNKLWSAYREGHFVWQKFLPEPRDHIFSVHLTEKDYQPEDQQIVEDLYHRHTFNHNVLGDLCRIITFREGLPTLFNGLLDINYKLKSKFINEYRIIDKTPTNVFKVDYLYKLFPDAKFIFLTRNGLTNISSLIDAWNSKGKLFAFEFREFYQYNRDIDIKNYDGKVWKFLNPPGWEKYLKGKSLAEVCAFQWLSANKYALDSFSKIPKEQVFHMKYEDLQENRTSKIRETCDFLEIVCSESVQEMFLKDPKVSTVSLPNKQKWLKNKDQLITIESEIAEMQKQLGYESLLT
jgi:hypothetical protein